MKILYQIVYIKGMGDDRFTYEGYRDAFEDLGHKVFVYTEKDNLQETLDKVKPDVFILDGIYLRLPEEAMLLAEWRRKGMKVIFHGAITKQIVNVINQYQMLDQYFAEIDPIEEFPNFPKNLFTKMHWLAASRKYHFPTALVEKYKCDICFVGANLPKKKEAFKKLLIPLFKKYHVKVYGVDWDWLEKYFLHPLAVIERRFGLGGLIAKIRLNRQVPVEDENKVYSSAKICLNITESHPGITLKTINARTFKIPASGGFEICDYVPQLREFFTEDEVVMPLNEKKWFEKIDYYLKNKDARKKIQVKGTERALCEHTFHSRVKQILSHI